jgi:serine/threonine protein phosphatase PrpC
VTVLRSGSATDVGRVRSANQDLRLEMPNLFAVADGMGGHAGGEVAAQIAVDSLRNAFSRAPTTDGLQAAFSEANQAIWQQSEVQTDLRGMGTTLTAVALVVGNDGRDVLALANVGDSRAYVYSGGRVTQVTADHSLAEEKVRQGELTEAEAAVHPHRHILTRALGVSSDVRADLWELHVRSGDRILLCSDGLTNEVGISTLGEVLGAIADPSEAARVLVSSANDHGGSDNITVVVVDVLVGESGGTGGTVIRPLGPLGGTAMVIASKPASDLDITGPPASVMPSPTNEPPTGSSAAMPTSRAQAGAATTAVPRVTKTPGVDPFAPGSQLGFTGAVPKIAGTGDDAFLTGAAETMAVAAVVSSPTEAVPAVRPLDQPRPRGVYYSPDEAIDQVVEPEKKESRREQRKRLGIPRRITLRVILFFLLILAVPVGAYFAIRWYANDDWFVTVRGDQVVVFQGRPGGVLMFKPKVVDRPGVTTAEILPRRVSDLKGNVEEASLADAKKYVSNLQAEYQDQLANTTSTTLNPFAVGPSGLIPTTVAPPASTSSTVPPPGATSTTVSRPLPVTNATAAATPATAAVTPTTSTTAP